MLVAEPFLAGCHAASGQAPSRTPIAGKPLLARLQLDGERAAAHAPIPAVRHRREDRSGALQPRERSDQEREQLVALLDATAAGDEHAFTELHRRTASRLRAAVHRVLRDRDLAEEAVQDAYVQIWHHAAGYSAALSAPMTWMTTVARNRAVDLLRQRTRERAWRVDSDDGFDYDAFASEAPDPERAASAACDLGALRRALEGLSAVERRALELTFVDGLSNVEVAAAMKAPLGTVKSWIRRGLTRLRMPDDDAPNAAMGPISGKLARAS